MTDTSARRWYVVETHPHAELKAAAHLLRQGFETYLPRTLKRRNHARRIERVAAPLFPRYLFVAIDRTAQRWRCIRSTFGVARFVSNGEDPAWVPDAVVDGLRARQDAQGFIGLASRPRFKPGETVCVRDGVFAACLGLFEEMTGGERVAVLLDLLGRKVRVVLHEDSVAAA
jgi:transcriptional antiterminator RfaH